MADRHGDDEADQPGQRQCQDRAGRAEHGEQGETYRDRTEADEQRRPALLPAADVVVGEPATAYPADDVGERNAGDEESGEQTPDETLTGAAVRCASSP